MHHVHSFNPYKSGGDTESTIVSLVIKVSVDYHRYHLWHKIEGLADADIHVGFTVIATL